MLRCMCSHVSDSLSNRLEALIALETFIWPFQRVCSEMNRKSGLKSVHSFLVGSKLVLFSHFTSYDLPDHCSVGTLSGTRNMDICDHLCASSSACSMCFC